MSNLLRADNYFSPLKRGIETRQCVHINVMLWGHPDSIRVTNMRTILYASALLYSTWATLYDIRRVCRCCTPLTVLVGPEQKLPVEPLQARKPNVMPFY